MFIHNTTPYKGKLYLKFEKYPYYTNDTLLNKVHLDLGFTKIVSRIKPHKTEEGYNTLDSDKIKLINEHTGGVVGIHEWWECASKKTGRIRKKYSEPDLSRWDVIFHGKLPDAFVSREDNTYIGDILHGWWYYKNGLKVYQRHPYGVALETDQFGKLTGVYGYSHRGGAMFEIGDRIFDPLYEPLEKHYPDWQWYGWVKEYEELYEKADEFTKKDMKETGIAYVIPFNMRGEKRIDLWDEAIQSAINLSKHLS